MMMFDFSDTIIIMAVSDSCFIVCAGKFIITFRKNIVNCRQKHFSNVVSEIWFMILLNVLCMNLTVVIDCFVFEYLLF